MDSSKNTNTINKLLGVLNLLFGGFSLTIGLIGLFGYAGIKELSYTLFYFYIGNDISPFSINPLVIISLFYIIFSFIAFGAGFSFIKQEHSAVKKSKLVSIVFLILFVLNTTFSIIAIIDMNLINLRKYGQNELMTKDIIMSKVESSVLKKLNDTVKFDKQGLTLPDFDITKEFTRWMITPKNIKKEIFEDDILAKLDEDKKELFENNYEFDNSDRVYYFIPNEKDPEKLIKLENKIIDELINIGFLNKFRVDTLNPSSTINQVPDTLFYLEMIDKDEWEVAYILENEKESMYYAKYYLFINKYDFIGDKKTESKKEHKYDVTVDKGETIYIKIDSYHNENLRENKVFWKLFVNQDGWLEKDGKEIPKDIEKEIGNNVQILKIKETNSNQLNLTIGWTTDEKINSDLKIYKLNPDNARRKILPRAPYMQKIQFNAKRDGIYRLVVTYDKALPFNFPFYLFIFIINLIVPLLILILINSSSVKEWLSQEQIRSDRPDVLSQIAGLNILLVPLQIWLSLGYLDSILHHQPQTSVPFIVSFIQIPSQIIWVALGIIGMLIIANSIIGLFSGYSLMSYSGKSKALLKSFSLTAIILLLLAFLFKIHSLNAIPNTNWTGIQALYNGINPSFNYLPVQKHLFAIFIFASNLAFIGVLLIYPLYIRSKIKGENIKNYFEELKEKK